MRRQLITRSAVVLCCAFLVAPSLAPSARAYSVLTHQAAVDAQWEHGVKPLLLRRFPRTSADDLLTARSYAYGGSVIQDLGYYPFGNRFFGNLLHYTRSGDFVERLIRDASDVNEYAFALGALAHYATDNTGHPEAVNRAVPEAYPKLRAKFGDRVTYADAPKEHVIVEFSFDIVQAAGGAYLPQSYQSLIGFRVSVPLLERAFRETYGLEMKDVLGDEERAIDTYRFAVSEIVPAITKAAWHDKHDKIEELRAGISERDFIFRYGRADFEKKYGTNYQRPAWFARFLGFLYRFLPKIGPLRPLSFKSPTPDVEKMFADSFHDAVARYQRALADVSDGRFSLTNTNFDTGKIAVHGDYRLADETYAMLLDRLDEKHFLTMPPGLDANIIAFYGQHPTPSLVSKDERKDWPKIRASIATVSFIQQAPRR